MLELLSLLGFSSNEERSLLAIVPGSTGTFRRFFQTMLYGSSWASRRPIARPDLIQPDVFLYRDRALWIWHVGSVLLSRLRSLPAAECGIPFCIQCGRITGSWCDGCNRAFCTVCEESDFECCCCSGELDDTTVFDEVVSLADPSLLLHNGFVLREERLLLHAVADATLGAQSMLADLFQRSFAASRRVICRPQLILCHRNLWQDRELFAWHVAYQVVQHARSHPRRVGFSLQLCCACGNASTGNCIHCVRFLCNDCLLLQQRSVVRCADSDEHHTPVLPLLSQSDSSSSHVPDSGQHELSPEDSPQRKGVDAQMENAWTSFVSALQALGYRYMHKIEDKFRVPKDGNIFQVLKDIAISVGVSSSEAHHWARSFSTEDACFFLASLPATIANMRVSCGLETTSDMFHLSLQEISMQTYAPCLPALGSLYKLVQLSPISSRVGVSFSVITGKWYQSSKSSPPPEMALKACISFDDGPPPVKGPIGVEDRQFGPLPSALLEAGFESKREVGRLTKPELKSLLPGWSEFELDAFLSSCLSSSSIDPSTPPRLRSVLPLHAVSIPVAGPRPRRPRKRTDAAPQTVEQIEEEGKVARRWHAEKLIELTLLTCPQSDISKQAAEYHAKDLLHEWKSGLANSIATRFELSSLRPAVSEWNRLIKECADPMDALALHHYISSRADKGNTVGPGVMSKLNFLSRTLSIPFPLQSPILAMWKTATAGHVVHPQEAIPPHIFLHLSDIACSKTCTAARTFSRIILRWLTSGLRFAHTLRATRQVHLSNPSRCIWLVHKGKKSDKSGFYFPVPSHLRQHCAVFSELQSELKQSLGDAADGVFLPDISDGGSITDSLLRSGPCATAYHMTYSKATTIIRGLCELHPLSMSMEQSSELNTYCLRKFLATTAGLLSLDEESSNHIGNWASGQKPMHVRYQSKAMDTGAHVRRMLLAAVEIACMASAQSQPPQQVSWDSVASLRSKMDRLEKLAIKPSWMGNDQVLIVDDFLFESDPPPAKKAKSRSSLESEDSSSSSGSSSDSDSDSSADPEPADSDSAEWYAPPRGLLHFLRSTAEERVPFCSSRPFATRDGCTSGSSIAAARSSGLQFCPTCASKVGIVALILADRLTQAASSAVVAIQPGPPLFHLVVAALELDIDYSHASLWVFLLLVGAMIGCIFTHVFYLVRRLYSALCLRTQEVSNIDPVVSSTNRRNVLVQTPTRYHNGRFTPLASGFHGAWDD